MLIWPKRERDKLSTKLKKRPEDIILKKYRNILKNLIKTTKMEYYPKKNNK